MADKLKIIRRNGFTVLPNTPARDSRLSLAAKGLFWVMMSLPDDWEFSIRGLSHVAGDGHGCGRDAVSAGLKALEDAGYLLREQRHDEAGKFVGNTYILYDESTQPLTGFPSTEKPLTENPSTDLTKQRAINNPPISPQGAARETGTPKWKPERFGAFWSAYPKKQAKVKAARAWDRLRADDETLDAMARGLKRWLRSDQWSRGIIPLASTWLNARRWEDSDIPEGDGGGVPIEHHGEERYGWQ